MTFEQDHSVKYYRCWPASESERQDPIKKSNKSIFRDTCIHTFYIDQLLLKTGQYIKYIDKSEITPWLADMWLCCDLKYIYKKTIVDAHLACVVYKPQAIFIKLF